MKLVSIERRTLGQKLNRALLDRRAILSSVLHMKLEKEKKDGTNIWKNNNENFLVVRLKRVQQTWRRIILKKIIIKLLKTDNKGKILEEANKNKSRVLTKGQQ